MWLMWSDYAATVLLKLLKVGRVLGHGNDLQHYPMHIKCPGDSHTETNFTNF